MNTESILNCFDVLWLHVVLPRVIFTVGITRGYTMCSKCIVFSVLLSTCQITNSLSKIQIIFVHMKCCLIFVLLCYLSLHITITLHWMRTMDSNMTGINTTGIIMADFWKFFCILYYEYDDSVIWNNLADINDMTFFENRQIILAI